MARLLAREYVEIALGERFNEQLKVIENEIVWDTHSLFIAHFKFNDGAVVRYSFVVHGSNWWLVGAANYYYEFLKKPVL